MSLEQPVMYALDRRQLQFLHITGWLFLIAICQRKRVYSGSQGGQWVIGHFDSVRVQFDVCKPLWQDRSSRDWPGYVQQLTAFWPWFSRINLTERRQLSGTNALVLQQPLHTSINARAPALAFSNNFR